MQHHSASEEILGAGTVPPSSDESREKAVSGLQAAFGLQDNGETLRALKRPSETCKSTVTCDFFQVICVHKTIVVERWNWVDIVVANDSVSVRTP